MEPDGQSTSEGRLVLPSPDSGGRPTVSTRDPEQLRAGLECWLASRSDGATPPVITELHAPEGNGMSSETLLFDVDWPEPGGVRRESLVARMAPQDSAVPVFPSYDLALQFRLMQDVAAHSAVPVPPTLWLEEDPEVLGGPFFVMRRVQGRVPPDVLPYNFGSWLTEADPTERRRLQDASVGVLAGLHAIDPGVFGYLDTGAGSGSALRRHVDGQRRYYEWVAAKGRSVPLVERCFEWMERHWPETEGPAVLSWGDARIGNIMYQGFEPVAVLDWEMAGLAPREVDLGWMIFLHRFFEDIARLMELPGLPDFMDREDVEATYAELTGHVPADMDFYILYAALRHGAIMSRVKQRSIQFGEEAEPDDPNDLILHRASLEALIDGSYWAEPVGPSLG